MLLYIASLENICVLIIFCLQRDQKFRHYTEDLKILHLSSSQELAYQKFYETLCRVMVLFKTIIKHWY